MNDRDVLLHDVPFPMALRIALCAVGVVIAVLVTYELGRGVWPLNLTSAFFAMIILGGWTMAFAAFMAGMFTVPTLYEFRRGSLTVSKTWFRTPRRRTYVVADLAALTCRVQESSEGPDMHFVEISTRSGDVFKSRMFDTEVTARKHEAEFRRALGM
jgi:hypothetical protein